MLNNAQVITFLATQNPGSAKQFYQQKLGLTLVADEPFALVFDANGTSLRLQKVASFQPQPFTAFGWQVTNIKATLQSLLAKDISFEQFPGLDQDDLGISQFPDGTQVAWFKDSDGNLLSLTQVPE